MGDFRARKIKDPLDRRKMAVHALDDIAAFEKMLADHLFDEGPPKIGAEQELCIINSLAEPAKTALELLKDISDRHYTNELALFNLEINLDPVELKDACFQQVENDLLELLSKGRQHGARHQSDILMCGILPTLGYCHLQFEYMTPMQRYKTISKALSEIRGSQFEIHLQGRDELIMSLDTVLFEACNTSFQLHLQIHPDEFVDQHNWAQMIAGPVLSACVNSPLLFGRELWAETRIALFKQSLDTRSSQNHLYRKMSRVFFGNRWLKESPAELWKDTLMRFPMLVTSDSFQNASEELAKGNIPDLRAIRLHNGTTYTWNRLCYGHSAGKPHLRIENRYLPSGPSAIDEIANFAFWIGLMNGQPQEMKSFWKKTDFSIAKNNFIKAARSGLQSVFNWFGKSYAATELILELLLPLSAKGLAARKVAQPDIDKYLSVIERRVRKEQTGADWLVRNHRRLRKSYGRRIAQQELTQQMVQYQKENIAVAEWDNMVDSKLNFYFLNSSLEEITVGQMMSTGILAIKDKDSIELAEKMMQWRNIHHLPVENKRGELVGLLTDGLLNRIGSDRTDKCLVEDHMLKDILTIKSDESLKNAAKLMDEHGLSGLPVTFQKRMVGILTRNDLAKVPLRKKTRPRSAELES